MQQRASNVSSAKNSMSKTASVIGDNPNKKALTFSSLANHFLVSAHKVSFSKNNLTQEVSKISKNLQQLDQNNIKATSIRLSKGSINTQNRFNGIMGQSTKYLNDSLNEKTSRTSPRAANIKPKKIDELKEETQLILSKFINKKKAMPSRILDSENNIQHYKESDVVSLLDMDNEMSTSLFSSTLMKTAKQGKLDNSVNLGNEMLYNKKTSTKGVEKAKDKNSNRSKTDKTDFERHTYGSPNLTLKSYLYSSPYRAPKRDIINHQNKNVIKNSNNKRVPESSSYQDNFSSASFIVKGKNSPAKEVSNILLKKTRESPKLLMTSPAKKLTPYQNSFLPEDQRLRLIKP